MPVAGSTVLVLGGGVGGVVAGNVLAKTLPRGNRVVLVDRNDTHNFRSSFPLLLVNKRRPHDLSRKLERLRKKGVDFIQAEATGISPGRKKVETDCGSLDYDFLILSPGAEFHPETVPGFTGGAYNPWSFEGASRLREKLTAFTGGRIVFFISSLPFSCPPAPYEIMFLLDAYFRQRGIREKVELTLVTPEPTPEPLAGPKVGESVRRMMEERGIILYTEAKVLSLDPARRVLHLDHGIDLAGDLFLGVPPHWGPSFLADSGLVEEGNWITVDPHTLQTPSQEIYAIGDATALRLPVWKVWAPKAGIFAHYQAEVVSRNIASLIAGRKPSYRYTGKGL